MFVRFANCQPLADQDFAAMLEAEMPMLRGFARSLTKNADAAEDLVQDCALNAWRARGSFQRDSSFRAWICRIARNRFLTNIRRNKWVGPMPVEEPAQAPNQLDRVYVREVRHQIEHLPPHQREAILLVAGGETYETVADLMGCEIGTVKSRVCRARQALAGGA